MDETREIRKSHWIGHRACRRRMDKTFSDIRYETADGIAKITIARPEVRNAFRPLTTKELIEAFDLARDDPAIGVVILTGEGPLAFSSGGDQGVRGTTGTSTSTGSAASTSSTSRSRSAGSRSRWSRWSPATRSAAGTCSTCAAT